MRFTCRDDSPARVYLWLLRHLLSWGGFGAALHSTQGCHCRLGMKSPPCIYLLPEQLLEHSLFARSLRKSTDFCLSAPCVLCSLQANTGGVPARFWHTLSLKLELYGWSLWCFQPQLFHDVFAFTNSCFQEEILHLMWRDASGFAPLPVSSKASTFFHSD